MEKSTLDRAIDAVSMLPGIGRKSAQRIVFFCIKQPTQQIFHLAEALSALKTELHECPHCFNFSSGGLCEICSNPKRDGTSICVVEDALSLKHLERALSFHGHYHVLGGVLSPLEGVTPEQLHLHALRSRLEEHPAQEVILALNPTLEGEATSHYIAELLKGLPLTLTRLASGIPSGGSLDYVDDVTMARAFTNRQIVSDGP